MNTELFEKANRWLEQDNDEETRLELTQLLQKAQSGRQDALSELQHRFSGRLQFGTGGLRGPLQAGPMGMNRVLVSQSAAGLAAYLQQYDAEPSVVIGYDGRKNSRIFARDTAEIMAGAGIRTLLLPRCFPTPLLAFAIRYFDVSAGVMVTASHNPPQDNGYKVYLGKANCGAQIVSPADEEIAALINLQAASDIRDLPRSDAYAVLDDEVLDAYIERTRTLVSTPPRNLNYVYTAMHGVGKEVLLKTLNAAGLPPPHLVAQQVEPDAAFPTVEFPNPEEKGALDLAYRVARERNAELILANDPDADRLGVALPDGEGNWKPLHGNMIGCLLAWHIAQKAQQNGLGGTLACSLVSTPALAEIAARYGLQHAETLTGFKYISRVPNLLYGFEESLGYLVDPDKVRDKDGISAAVVFLDLVGSLQAQGKTLQNYLDEFVAEFGAYASSQISLRVARLADIPRLMAAFRNCPPDSVGTEKVVHLQDYMQEAEPNDILVYRLANGSRMIVRPSGTEPKVKVYLDVQGSDAADAERALAQLEKDVKTMLRSDTYGNLNC